MDYFSISRKLLAAETPLVDSRSYLSYGSPGPLRKSEGLIDVCVVYPNLYSMGMSNLGYMIACDVFDGREGVLVDRAFLPERGQKETRGLVTGRMLRDFDIVVFSVSYELDFLNIEKILKAGGIEPDRNKRRGPFVLCGGVAASINPYALSGMADLVLTGDAEVLIPEFIENFKNGNIPDENTGNELKKLRKLENCFFSTVITKNSVFPGTVLLDGGRGCAYSCKFCVTGNYFGPFLCQDAKRFIDVASGLKPKGCTRFGIVSSSIGRIAGFDKFLEYAVQNRLSVSVSSIRFEDIDKDMAELLFKAGQRQFTLAPEAGNYDLRRSIAKPVSNGDILKKISMVHSLGAGVKLYFMFGLPGETERDLVDIINLLKEAGKTGQVKAGIQAFVPKPHTSFTRGDFAGEAVLKKKKKLLLEAAFSGRLPKNILDIAGIRETVKEWELCWKGRPL
ncbi:MAG: radical SAM protein [Oligoflexia bacterium]|nr:radical SAM protein [Oligoflexia bacterium]